MLGSILGVLGAGVSRLPVVLELDQSVGLAALFAIAPGPQHLDEVAVVSISRATFERLGLPDELDEWPRARHAALVERLVGAGAATIVFDLSFAESRAPASDREFSAALARAGNVLLLERTRPPAAVESVDFERANISHERREPPAPIFARAALGSAPFILPIVPIRLSQFWVFDRLGANLPNLPALALHAYALELGVDPAALIEHVEPSAAARLRLAQGPVADGGLERAAQAVRDLFAAEPDLATRLRAAVERLPAGFDRELRTALIDLYAGPSSGYLRYYGSARTIPTIPYETVLAGEGDALPVDLTNRAVFVGLAEASQSEQLDDFYSVYSGADGQNLSGVEIGATAFANLLHRDLIVPLGIWSQLGALLAWGLLVGAIAMTMRQRWVAVLLGVATLAYVGSAASLFAWRDLWLPLFVPLLLQVPIAIVAAAMWRSVLERARRRRVGEALSSYVPEAAIADIERAPISRDSARALIDGVCLVSDAERYTELGERLRPEELAALMNEYYELLFGIVERHDGIVTDTAGDSMIAIWQERGSGSARSSAARAAAAIQAALVMFNEQHPGRELVTGIGIDAGELLMTNVGSGTRFNFRAVGDTVNTAARVQSLSRQLGSRVLAVESATARLDELRWRSVGRFRLAGKTRAVEVYELLMGSERVAANELATFAAALEAFQAGRWQDAIAGYERLLETWPDDGPARFYLRQCRELAQVALPADWDGSVESLRK